MPITCTGSRSAKSRMKSNESRPTSPSTISTQSSRIWASRPATARGVNSRDTMPRCIVCIGGSSKMNRPGGISMPWLMML